MDALSGGKPKMVYPTILTNVLILIVGGCPFGLEEIEVTEATIGRVLILIVGGCPFGRA